MALRPATIAGVIAGIGLPMVMRGLDGPLGTFVSDQSVHFRLFDVSMRFSWAIFAVVTLAAWLFFRAARNR